MAYSCYKRSIGTFKLSCDKFLLVKLYNYINIHNELKLNSIVQQMENISIAMKMWTCTNGCKSNFGYVYYLVPLSSICSIRFFCMSPTSHLLNFIKYMWICDFSVKRFIVVTDHVGQACMIRNDDPRDTFTTAYIAVYVGV